MTPTILTHFVPGYTWPLAGGPRSATYGIGAQRGISLLLQSIGLHKARIVGLCAWFGARDILRHMYLHEHEDRNADGDNDDSDDVDDDDDSDGDNDHHH